MSLDEANAAPLSRFSDLLSQALTQGRCDKLVMANYQGDDAQLGPDLQRVLVRPVELKGQPHLSFVLRYPTKDITKNLPLAEGMAHVMGWAQARTFRNAHLHTPTAEVQLAFSKKGKASVRVGKPSNAEAAQARAEASAAGRPGTAAVVSAPSEAGSAGHNRDKHRFLELSRPFLHELGVTDAHGHLIPAMSRKWKQINKFVEVFAAALARSPLAEQNEIHVVDFGSGKGYLTFAIHDWLRHSMGRDARVTGVELRDELVKLCQRVIGKLQLEGMDYEQGDVREYHPTALNVMIALHACDVATDYAIHLGIRAGAEIIMCSPCCHKQIRPQLLSPHPLRPILQHGIHLGQEAEMLTDGLRAMLLDAAGYDTQVFEFISLEHTNKNKMILAVKRAKAKSNDEVVAQIKDIKAFYGIQEQCLESLLKADGLLPA
ncbi:MAG TPA: SAM-dependent methyltransferase [Aquabacterium sp.]|uniref:class I SAM-dependent methyltransferase n=1 Tax=Aquabacterium sp. TaxID=1872578 RepID=UPI002E2EC128|nr:SAM-dependent methyltransferase [Aquabacterium sp.]HEX5356091.1 SAM-dependent methyltransferase [Aquabacterium sp.]